MLSNKLETEKTRGQFEQALIEYLSSQRAFSNSYDRLADYLSEKSGKEIDGRKINFLSRGDAYAKKWLIECLLETALIHGWVPFSTEDWENCIWVVTGKRQSVFGGDNTRVYEILADMSGKTEGVFEASYQKMLQESNYGQKI